MTSEQSITQPPPSGKVRRSRQWWQFQYDTWKNSGLSKPQFCRTHSINISSFYNWSLKLSADDSQPSNPTPTHTKNDAFVPVNVVDSEISGLHREQRCNAFTVTINQMTVRIDADLLPTELAPWLTELRSTLCSV